MGIYATTSSISELMPGYLVGNTTASDTVGAALFSRHIDRAEGIVMSTVGARYDVAAFRVGTTTTNVPPMLRTLSEDIACWFAARAAYAQDGNRKQMYLDAFEIAKETLTDIRDGKTKLAYTDGAEVPPRSAARFLSSTNYTPIFGLDDPESWAVDDDQRNDIADSRV
jgi:hypothetical protein